MSTFEELFMQLARIGCRITVFPIVKSKQIEAFQVNVSQVNGSGWICVTNKDPLIALKEAAAQRIKVDGPGNQLPIVAELS